MLASWFDTRQDAPGLAAGGARAELVAPASNGFVTHLHTALEQQFLNVSKVELEAKIPPYGLADNGAKNRCPR